MRASGILVATPVDGAPHGATVTHAYHVGVRQLERSGACILSADLCFADDLARGRSRCVWYALNRDDWSWMLWWDEDVCVPNTLIVPRMIELATEHGWDMIGAPYPRKRIPATFPYRPLSHEMALGSLRVEHDCIEVEALGFGFVLTSRKCLQSMVDHYREAEWWTDAHDPNAVHETVALFRQVMTEPTTAEIHGERVRFRDLYSEDYSFCWRWRRMGGRIFMYVGDGAPLGHVGGHLFTGTRGELGNVR